MNINRTWADKTTEATVLFTSSTPKFLNSSSRCACRMQATFVSPSLYHVARPKAAGR